MMILHMEAARARGDWSTVDCLHAELFAEIKQQHRLNYYEDLRWVSQPWLYKKFLNLKAQVRTLFK